MPQGGGDTRKVDSRSGFEWRCPVCSESRVNVTDNEKDAVVALQIHIRASDGGGHGPVNDFPADVDASKLADRVVRVDRSEKSTERG